MRGFVPARRDPFVSAKGPKTIFACARPCGYLHLRPEYRWLRNSLRSDNARQSGRFGLRFRRTQRGKRKMLLIARS